MIVKGLSGDMLLEWEGKRRSTIWDLEGALKEAKPEWKWQCVQFTCDTSVLQKSCHLSNVADKGTLNVTATATPFCLSTVEEALRDCFERAGGRRMAEDPWGPIEP